MTLSKHIAKFGRNMTIMEAAALGAGAGILQKRITGHVGVSSTALRDISANMAGANLVFLAAAGAIEAVSSDAADAAAGAGALVIVVEYLDITGVEKTLEIILTGTTEVVSTETDVYRVNRAYVKTFGSAAAARPVNSGNITVRASGGGTAIEFIAIGENESWSARYTVPTGFIAYLMDQELHTTTVGTGKTSIEIVSDRQNSLDSGVFAFTNDIEFAFRALWKSVVSAELTRKPVTSERVLPAGATILARANPDAAEEMGIDMVLLLFPNI